jgi:hypothetical protein
MPCPPTSCCPCCLAGAYAMRLSSVAYKSWRFRLQKPAADLEAR